MPEMGIRNICVLIEINPNARLHVGVAASAAKLTAVKTGDTRRRHTCASA
jgi:hypothetical protein